MLCDLGDLGYDLNGARRGTDDGDALPDALVEGFVDFTHSTGADRAHEVQIPCAAYAGDLGPKRFGDLHRISSDSTRSAVY